MSDTDLDRAAHDHAVPDHAVPDTGSTDITTRYSFFTGKGGVGKTSLSAGTAVALARQGRRVLLVSTDPASNLSEVLGTEIGHHPSPVAGVTGLDALDIDPEAAAEAYRERVVGPYRDVLPATVVASITEQLSGACTVEIAAFDEFTALLADPAATDGYDHVVFDTAPTGHTLRLLELPGAWTGFLDTSTAGVTCIGPMSGLTQAHDRYRTALAALSDPALTTLVLVTRPDPGALAEAERARGELADLGLRNQRLLVNGVFAAANELSEPAHDATPAHDPTAAALTRLQHDALAMMPSRLRELPRRYFRLLPEPPLGADALAALLEPSAPGTTPDGPPPIVDAEEGLGLATTSLAEIADEVASTGRGLLMTMGKGGVGKTTIAAALAVHLADRGLPVTLSTTDPAAHVSGALAGERPLPPTLTVERIDPVAATAAYTAEVIAEAGAGLDGGGLAVLEEDLRSPCTEEIAVFRAFAATVAAARDRIVVLDTAPTGHTLLLLDAAHGYQREVERLTGGAAASVDPGDRPGSDDDDGGDGDDGGGDGTGDRDGGGDEIASLLDRLRDPAHTRLLLIALPEPTPVHEAAALQDDLARAGIRPAAWVVNQTLTGTGTEHPVLAAKSGHERRWLDEVRRLHPRLAIVPWQSEPPVGPTALTTLLHRN